MFSTFFNQRTTLHVRLHGYTFSRFMFICVGWNSPQTYDYILRLDDEITYIRNSGRSKLKLIYFFTRYVSFVMPTIRLFKLISVHYGPEDCLLFWLLE
ncbi:hypothetical protein SERLA73DRAFT_172672, partial [Serpula lacrymans var. lacrymans S7.3]